MINNSDFYLTNELNDVSGKIYKNKYSHKVLATITIVLCAILLFFFLVFVKAETVYITSYVSGPSMMPTLNLDYNDYPNQQLDIVYLNSYEKGIRGDIIVDNYYISQDKQYVIKRLIALPGDTLKIYEPQNVNEPTEVYVNGVLIDEPYILEAHFGGLVSSVLNNPKWNPQPDGTITIPDGYVFYMGDNRNNSSDCRSTGPREEKHLKGRVDFIVRHCNNEKPLTSADLFWPGVQVVFKSIGNWFCNIFN